MNHDSRQIRKAPGESLIIGKHPQGCRHCLLGGKLVLYITGACDVGCPYCPIPTDRQGISDAFVNERRITSFEDVVDESKKINAEGVGITGGDPMKVPQKTITYIKRLKQIFGKDYHIHLYTSGFYFLNGKDYLLKELYEAGLDEIRFHPKNIRSRPVWEIAKKALQYDWDVGFEVPCIPGKEKDILELIKFADENKFKFVNLNEYEFTEANFENLSVRGFIASSSNSAVKGSRETAIKILKKAQRFTKHVVVHFCTSGSKDSIQLRQRFRRRAHNIKKPYHEVTEDGLLLYARAVFVTKDAYEDFLETLPDFFDVPSHMFEAFPDTLTVHLPWYVLEEIASDVKAIYKEHIRELAIIEQFPIENGMITRLDPL